MRTKTLNRKSASGSGSARRLSSWAVALAATIFALVPLAFNPDAVLLYVPAAFYLVKFKLLVGLSAALLAAVAGAALSGAKLARVPLLLPVLAFLGVSALSAISSEDIMHSLVGESNRHDGLLTLAAGVLLFYAAARFLDSWRKVRMFLIAGVVSAALISIYGVLQMARLDPVLSLGVPWYVMEPVSGPLSSWYTVVGRAFSTLGWPLWLAAYLTLMMGAALALYVRAEAKWERGLWLAALGLMSACWLLTYSRSSMLAVAVTVLAVLLLARFRLGAVKPLLLPLAVVAVAALAAPLAIPHAPTPLDRFGKVNLARALEDVPKGGDVNVTTRLLMWRDAIPVIAERPLLGHGPDNFAEPFERHQGEDLEAFLSGGAVIDKAHNEFLQVAATTGLLGLAAYLWLFASYFRAAYRSGGWVTLSLSGAVLAYILQLQTAFTTIGIGVAFWAILGVSVAAMRLEEHRPAKSGSSPNIPGEHTPPRQTARRRAGQA